ncbi:MAG: hypothetical protein GWN01_06345 [Nitrosopumilaceae archaeon]|nr:hypothetical protein [Nitrosopumilaceae archaeon]NIU00558.1 hypothetical protein [Nitrosopumilaceae archaeon]NIU86944.1 hypothetical protein [Nitrosopumilaceae archaeon]NIV66408.1 hypothetical protein [Nitrosopumilaceae archaeon]NIX61160.1 hypothetical protein [Nitrosopumilaceae archaeon]
MEHTFYFAGSPKKISWVNKTNDNKIEQMRDHADIYLDKVNGEQSKYIAMHVGIFWCIGMFIIKNEDTVRIMVDSDTMYEHLTKQQNSKDLFIETRTKFFKQLVEQRQLNIIYEKISKYDNQALKLI